MIDSLVERGASVIEGEEAAPRIPFEQSVDEYIGRIHSTSTLNRAVLGIRAGTSNATCARSSHAMA